jgi:hypothetical protein
MATEITEVSKEESLHDSKVPWDVIIYMKQYILYGIAGVSPCYGNSYKKIYPKTDKYPRCLLLLVLNNVFTKGRVFIELKHTETNKYIWFIKCENKFDGKEFMYSDDMLTFVVIKSLLCILAKECAKVIAYSEDDTDGAYDVDNVLYKRNAHENMQNAHIMFNNYKENTGYECIPEILYENIKPCAIIILMYAVFCDTRKWSYETIKNSSDNKQENSNYISKSGYVKTVRIGGVTETIRYRSGEYLDVCNSSFGSCTRASIDDYII